MARLTLYGMYSYLPSLFDTAPMPEGLDKQMMIAEIMSHSGDLYPYYQVPEILKANIGFWFTRRKYDFEQMFRALTAEYNPIENYNRYEDLKRQYENGGSDDTTRVYHGTDEGSTKRDETRGSESTGNDSSTTTLGTQVKTDTTDLSHNDVSAFNESTYTPRDKSDRTGTSTTANSGTDTVSTTSGATTTDTLGATGSDSRKTDSTDDTITNYGATRDEKENNHVHGNIGVTTNQQMIDAELEMRKKYDLYTVIASLFEREFVVQLY